MDCPLSEPRLTWRRYQGDVLQQIDLNDDKMLIVAPPGSGKTLVGLELIRRLGEPAVVFAPTTIIAKQWKEKLSFFSDNPDGAGSIDPERPAFVTSFTYQRISTRSQANEAMRNIAREMWSKELRESLSPEEAEAELERIRKENPDYYKKKILGFIGRLRKEYDKTVVERGLHGNAKRLIARLKEYGVKIIILDECHHLLDYWGLVIKYLRDELGAKIIALTATYPISEDRDVFFELAGEVDYEVSTPAVVKEGYLAPYRELALFVTPTAEEVELIESEMRRVRAVFDEITQHERFPEFLEWSEDQMLFRKDYLLYEAIYKHTDRQGLSYDEKLILMKGFLDYAYPLLEEKKQLELFHVMRSNGISYTSRTLHVSRSVEKYVLSYSESRINGAVEILKQEHRNCGDRLRALVLADFDKHVPAKRLKPGKSMGSATYIFHHLVNKVGQLDPVLVTGKRLYCDEDIAQSMVQEIRDIAKERGLDIKVRAKVEGGFAKIEGSGAHWKPSTYTLIVTGLFARGVTRLLVGTRGIFGEGWDSLKLNTLVDLTATSFGTGIQQVRGRTLRLDPEDPGKVSHNWDVVCVYPDMTSQMGKLWRKHGLIYGIDDHGRIAKGLHHLDKDLRWRFHTVTDRGFYVALGETNSRMEKRMEDRGRTRQLWGLGAVYEDRDTAVVTQRIHGRITPVHTINWLYFVMKAVLVASLFFFGYYALYSDSLAVCLVIMILWFLSINAVFGMAYLFLLRNPVPEERVVADIARTVYHSMKDEKLTDDSSSLKLSITEEGMTDVALYGKGSRAFADAMRQLLSRPINPRYIILYDVSQPVQGLPVVYQFFVSISESIGIKKQYFAVPTYFAANKKRMELFAKHWRMHVGGGRFIYTRSEEGARALRELTRSSMHDWIADVSSKVYWDFFGSLGKDSRTIR